ncbi:diablo IAP-binding mitochondrial protein-like isoform X1 [Brienomyrus brachyistius]|uniref:diablo IAP-binding mitochondrial protein-like isoform X1 n=1 Tax=Brienomyrus brachyistius TaxID=42636 RepID=UPI0020B23235|nr:diablo IAP-binding mitochondrial protein-like isoform X1 [Brienomyrus brachyistius]
MPLLGCLGTRSLSQGSAYFLLLPSNMAAYRRGLAVMSFLRCSIGAVVGGSSSPRRLAKLPAAVRRTCVSLCAAGGLCALPFSQKETAVLSHEALIRRASSLMTDGANTYLSQTTLALVESLTNYVKAMHTLLALQQRYVTSVSKLNPTEEDTVWQVIIRQRQEVTDRREECRRFEMNWMNAINLSELAAEAAFNAGADQASVTARTNLQVAQEHVEQVRQLSLEAEQKLVDTKAENMERMSAGRNEEEEDIPDAYLRED